MRSFLLFFCLTTSLLAQIQLVKKENNDSNTTLLVIGGIHGDEPGGYYAASILITNYTITSKNLWIVPNLNQESIRNNLRGINGDMNRKFSAISNDDLDQEIVAGIKKIILKSNVSMILNLHDGHGFYRKEHQGNIFNPNAWGQACVIDQMQLDQNQPFGNLNDIALNVKQSLNQKLIQQHHTFDVKNTNTKFDDETMQHSLTYFAVTNNKPAFAIESSKNLPTLSEKVFYQLLAIEEFMKIMGISYQRDFELNIEELEKIVKNYGNLSINNNIILNLSDIKKSLSFIPIKSSTNEFIPSHPLASVNKEGGSFSVLIGGTKVTQLKPQYFQNAQDCPKEFEIEIDGKKVLQHSPSTFFVSDDFKVIESENIRVNVIGYKSSIDESNVTINLNQLDKRFSVDENGKVYRIEFYKQNDFCSMLMVHFK